MSHQYESRLNVAILAALVAAAKEDQLAFPFAVVHAVSRPEIHFQLADTARKSSKSTWITVHEPIDSGSDSRPRANVLD